MSAPIVPTALPLKHAPALPSRTLASANFEQDTQLSFQEPSAVGIPTPGQQRWMLPAVAGLAATALAGVAIFFAVTRTSPATGAPLVPSATTAPSPPAASVTPVASGAVAASQDVAPVVSAPSASVKKPFVPRPAGAPKVPAASPTPLPTGPKKPPANPYEPGITNIRE